MVVPTKLDSTCAITVTTTSVSADGLSTFTFVTLTMKLSGFVPIPWVGVAVPTFETTETKLSPDGRVSEITTLRAVAGPWFCIVMV